MHLIYFPYHDNILFFIIILKPKKKKKKKSITLNTPNLLKIKQLKNDFDFLLVN